MKKCRVCLNMIVKDESRVIQRCLDSLKRWIDYWVIVDTGSTDGTQAIIEQALKDVPGELHQTSWVDFAHCRNLALDLAKEKGEYMLFIDADETFIPQKEGFTWPHFDKDCYFGTFLLENGSLIQRLFLADARLKWRWKGALHEELTAETPRTGAILKDAQIRVRQDGRRSQDLDKHLKDAKILEQEHRKDPQNSRTLFYLAGSYDMAKEVPYALDAYRKRAKMGGWGEEIYYSLYRVAVLEEQLNKPSIGSYCRAYAARPTRAEPLFMLGRSLILGKRPFLAYLLAGFALRLPFPEDRVFVEKEVYDYKLLTQRADAALLLGFCDEAAALLRRVLQKESLPHSMRKKIETAFFSL